MMDFKSPIELVAELNQAISETFEQIIFQEVDTFEAISVLPENLEGFYHVSIQLLEPWHGGLSLIIPAMMAAEVVADLIDEQTGDDIETMTKDAINEVANTVAGRFMAKIIPDTQSFTLGLPSCVVMQKTDQTVTDVHAQLFSHQFGEVKLYSVLQPDQDILKKSE